MSSDDVKQRIISLLNRHGRMTRKQLCDKLHMPRTTVYDYLRRLMKAGKVARCPDPDHPIAKGRPVVYFFLDTEVITLS